MKIDDMVRILKGSGTAKEGREKLDAFLQAIKDEVDREGRCQIPGLGTFRKVTRAARTVRSPLVGKDPVCVPAKDTIVFKPAAEWKSALA